MSKEKYLLKEAAELLQQYIQSEIDDTPKPNWEYAGAIGFQIREYLEEQEYQQPCINSDEYEVSADKTLPVFVKFIIQLFIVICAMFFMFILSSVFFNQIMMVLI